MKKLLKWAIFIGAIILVISTFSSCGFLKEKTDVAVLNLYDDDGTFLTTVSLESEQNNVLVYSRLHKTGYKFKGIIEQETERFLFDENGHQKSSITFEKGTVINGIIYRVPIQYTTYFNAGEGVLTDTSKAAVCFYYDDTKDMTFPDVYCEGKTLDGWFDEDGTRYSDGIIPTTEWKSEANSGFYDWVNNSHTLYARYADKHPTVTLKYNDAVYPDVTITLSYASAMPDLSDYLYDNGTSIVTGFSSSPSAASSLPETVKDDLVLYAIWQEYKTVDFVYGDNDVRTEKVLNIGATVTLEPGEKDGYKFDGWYTSAQLSGTPVNVVTYASLENVYYAKWTAIQYTVTYMNGNTWLRTATFTVENMHVDEAPTLPEKTGYTATWPAFTLEPKDIVLYAEYVPQQLTVTLDDGTSTETASVGYQTYYVLPVPVREREEFTGWYCGDVQMTDATGQSLQRYADLQDKTFTAGWTAKRLVLSFNTNGAGIISPVLIVYGETYEITEKPQVSGCLFDGWYDETMTTEYAGSITFTENLKVYAKYVQSTPISDAEGLKAIANDTTGNYHLTANINLRGEEWTPIPEFSGTLNGNGYKIYNFTISAANPQSGFILDNKGSIKNVTFDKVDLTNNFVMWNEDGKRDVTTGIVCAVNNGTISNVKVTDSTILQTTEMNWEYNSNVKSGGAVGENNGSINSLHFDGTMTVTIGGAIEENNDCAKKVYIGGIVGIAQETSSVRNINSVVTMSVKGKTYAAKSGYEQKLGVGSVFREHNNHAVQYYRIGGLIGAAYGTVENGSVAVTLDYLSENNVTQYYYSYYSYTGYCTAGGAFGLLDQGGTATGITTSGSIDVTITGNARDTGYKYVGGVCGYVYTDAKLNVCSSEVDVTCHDCGSGYFGGIAGELLSGGRISNVDYYGNLTLAEGMSGIGVAGGLVGRNEGTLTQSLNLGVVSGKWLYAADITGETTANGSNTRCIDEGKLQVISATGEGTSNKCYIVDVTMSREQLYDADNLFEELALLDSETWSVEPGIGIYLWAFANDGHEHQFGTMTCSAQYCTVAGCHYISPATTEHSFTHYVFDDNADEGYRGTETAYCDYGCGNTHTRNR